MLRDCTICGDPFQAIITNKVMCDECLTKRIKLHRHLHSSKMESFARGLFALDILAARHAKDAEGMRIGRKRGCE